MVNDIQARGQYPSRPSPWYSERIGGDYYGEDGHITESLEGRRPPWTIAKGLRELCQIPGDAFFVAAERNGKVIFLSTPFGSSQLNHEKFFDKNAFLDEVKRIQSADHQSFDEAQLGFNTEVSPCVPDAGRTTGRDRRHYLNGAIDSCTEDGMHRSKKRPRAGSAQRGISTRQANLPMCSIQPKKGIRIGDSEAIYAFYDQRLKCCQQTACKIIAKAWVKAVAPKKQSTNPYTRGDQTRPDWWPKTYCKFGTDVHLELRHKEPDHLGKEERVFLLCHILRMLVEPHHNQHSAIRKVNLNLNTLEAVTFEALSSWFSDKDNPGNLSKKPILKEIFKVARQEARYRDGEIDGDTEIPVVPVNDNEVSKGSTSDSDDENIGLDQKFTSSPSIASPVDSAGQPMIIPQVQTNDHNEAGHYPNNYADTVPLRATYYSHPGYEHLSSQRTSYVDPPGIGNHAQPNYGGHGHLGLADIYSSPQGTSRRSPVFNAPSDYGSPATPVVYSPWPASSAPTNPPMYGFPQQQSSVPAFGGQMAQGPSYPNQTMDGLSR